MNSKNVDINVAIALNDGTYTTKTSTFPLLDHTAFSVDKNESILVTVVPKAD